MKTAENKRQQDEDIESRNRIRDLSEWSIADAEKIKLLKRSRPKVSTVGYSTIIGDCVEGRRTWGQKKEENEEKEKKEPESEDENGIPKNPEEFMDSLWKEGGSKKRRRDSDSGEKSKKKAAGKKSLDK